MRKDDTEPRQVFASYDGPSTPRDPGAPRNPYTGVVTLIVRDGRILLVRRRPGSFRGETWCLPGGYIEFHEDFLTAGRREVKEETGLSVDVVSILSVVSNFLSPRLHTLVVVLLAAVRPDSPPPAAGDDADALEWFAFDGELPEMAFEADRHIIGRYAATRLPGAPVDPRFAR